MSVTKRAKLILILVALVTAVAVYSLVDPSAHLFPRCLFLSATGWQCPGCGSQRAVHALLHGDVAGAWRFNAALVSFLPLIALLLVGELNRRCWPRLYSAVNSTPVLVACAVVLIGWWVLRNIFGWYV
ncbi:MAG: DUF2752 domain-containing protein [Pseudoflavonifractor sp.]|nr:DUF2752 domain-containing protein [Pseudoflavonifractor sp.]